MSIFACNRFSNFGGCLIKKFTSLNKTLQKEVSSTAQCAYIQKVPTAHIFNCRFITVQLFCVRSNCNLQSDNYIFSRVSRVASHTLLWLVLHFTVSVWFDWTRSTPENISAGVNEMLQPVVLSSGRKGQFSRTRT